MLQLTSEKTKPNASCMQSGVGIRLFQFQQNAAGGSWELCSGNPDLNFYDINEDSAAKKKEWHLELGSDIDIKVTDQFSVDATSKRVTLAADTAVYALKFPTSAALAMFESEYNSRLFENTYGLKYDDKNRDQVAPAWNECSKQQALCQLVASSLTVCHVCQVFGKDNVLTLGGETAESRQQWAEDMDVDVSFVIVLESMLLNLSIPKRLPKWAAAAVGVDTVCDVYWNAACTADCEACLVGATSHRRSEKGSSCWSGWQGSACCSPWCWGQELYSQGQAD